MFRHTRRLTIGVCLLLSVLIAFIAAWYGGERWAAPEGLEEPISGLFSPFTKTPGIPDIRGSARRLSLPNSGPGTTYSIYTYTATGDGFIFFHGFNKLPYTLFHASDTRLARDFLGHDLDEFASSVTFEPIFPAYSKTVGRWAHAETIVATLSRRLRVNCWSRSAIPPQLPKDGETVKLKNEDIPDGNDALWLGFSPIPDGVFFVIVGHPKDPKDVPEKR